MDGVFDDHGLTSSSPYVTSEPAEVTFSATFNTDGVFDGHGMTSSSPYVTSEPTEVTFSSTFNASDHVEVPEGCVVLRVSDFVPWDNPDNLISHQAEQVFEVIVDVFFLNILYLIR